MKKKNNENEAKFTEEWLPIKDIKNGMIEVEGKGLEGKQIVTGVRVEPKNIFISDQQTQENTIFQLRNFYNTIDYEFWLICCDRPVDLNLYRSELELMFNNSPSPSQRKLIIEDLNKAEQYMGVQLNAVDTEFYILFKAGAKEIDKIQKRIHQLISGLAAAGLSSRQITDEDSRALLDSFFNDGVKTEYGTVMSNV